MPEETVRESAVRLEARIEAIRTEIVERLRALIAELEQKHDVEIISLEILRSDETRSGHGRRAPIVGVTVETYPYIGGI